MGLRLCLNAAPLPRPHCWLALCVSLLMLLTGCGTTRSYKPNTVAGPAKPANYPVPIYTETMSLPRPCEVIGRLSIGDTELTVVGGSLEGVTKTLLATAREKGADAVQLVTVEKPDFSSAHYRIQADLLRYSTDWETVGMSQDDFLAYLQLHRQDLDPIEGIWSDGSSERLGIIKDASKPGRDFIAFTLNPKLLSWHDGYKKMDIAHLNRPGAYSVVYYRNDFVSLNTGILLDHDRTINFYLPADDGEYKVTLVKIFAPLPTK